MTLETDGQEKIDATFRNGSLTAVGIILGFSLSFVNRWASNPNDWSRVDIVPMVPMVLGIVLQVKVFADLLSRESLLVVKYDRARRVFLIGLLIVAVGVALALVNDMLGISRQALLG